MNVYTYDSWNSLLTSSDTTNGVAKATYAFTYNNTQQLTESRNAVSEKRVQYGYDFKRRLSAMDEFSALRSSATAQTYPYRAGNRLQSDGVFNSLLGQGNRDEANAYANGSIPMLKKTHLGRNNTSPQLDPKHIAKKIGP